MDSPQRAVTAFLNGNKVQDGGRAGATAILKK